MPALLPLLKNELRAFADRYELTPREHDVLSMLLLGASSVASIADGLQLSRNTIHNHFKNMFRRTGADNKAALVAMFARESAIRCARTQATHRLPRVVIVAPAHDKLARIEASITARGIKTATFSDASAAAVSPTTARADVVLVLGDGPPEDARQRLQQQLGPRPKVLTGYDLWGEPGYVAGLDAEGSLANDALVFGILLAFMEGDDGRSRLVRVEANLAGELSGVGPVQLANVGFGGAFVDLDPDQIDTLRGGVGQHRLRIDLPLQGALDTEVVIAWTRRAGRPALASGVGLAFANMTAEARRAVETFVRRRKLAWLALDSADYRRRDAG